MPTKQPIQGPWHPRWTEIRLFVQIMFMITLRKTPNPPLFVLWVPFVNVVYFSSLYYQAAVLCLRGLTKYFTWAFHCQFRCFILVSKKKPIIRPRPHRNVTKCESMECALDYRLISRSCSVTSLSLGQPCDCSSCRKTITRRVGLTSSHG